MFDIIYANTVILVVITDTMSDIAKINNINNINIKKTCFEIIL